MTENTFDAYMWQILENKQKFISQIMTSKSPVRACEDVDDTALSYAEIKALATGNPYIKEKMDLDVQVSKLKLLKANHTSQIYRLESDIAKNFPVQISALKERIAGMQVDSQVVKSVDLQDNDTFAMTVGNVLYEDKKEAGEALIAACAGLKTVSTGGKVGEYHGFTLSASYNMFSNAFELTIKGKCSYKLEIGKDPINPIAEERITLAEYMRESEAYLDQQEIKKLAVDLDNFSYEYDTYEYKDTVENREEQIEKITEDILNKKTECLKDWLVEVSEESDIDSDVITARSLLSRLENAETLSIFTDNQNRSNQKLRLLFMWQSVWSFRSWVSTIIILLWKKRLRFMKVFRQIDYMEAKGLVLTCRTGIRIIPGNMN